MVVILSGRRSLTPRRAGGRPVSGFDSIAGGESSTAGNKTDHTEAGYIATANRNEHFYLSIAYGSFLNAISKKPPAGRPRSCGSLQPGQGTADRSQRDPHELA